MKSCNNCQTPNPEAAKFCSNCGANLNLVCSHCGSDLIPNARFCSNCGQPQPAPVQTVAEPRPEIQAAHTSPPPASSGLAKYIPAALLTKLEATRDTGSLQDNSMLGERRIVTMMFCDIQGSTEAAGKLDPEEWLEIVNGAFEHMISPVYRYEGTIARLMGDGILAFFGAPIAHEDDPQRAVLASLDILAGIQAFRERILQDWGIPVNVRIGINTGLVVVGGVGSDLRMEYTALGDAINLAARMEQTAAPGTVQLTAATHRLIAPFFEFENIGEIEVRGKPEPVQAYQVLGIIRAPGQIRGIEGLESPLVGRDIEMNTLSGVIDGLSQGRGQVISIIGEAGLGKSRLVAELRASLSLGTDATIPLLWVEGRSLSYQTSTPYAPFIDLFSQHFSFDSHRADVERYQHIVEGVAAVAPDQVQDISPFLASLLGIEPGGEDAERIRYLSPPQLRQKVYLAVCTYLEALALRTPLVIVLDDVHWIDPTSLELLKHLLPLTEHAPLVVMALFRPRRNEPSWQFHEMTAREFGHRYTSIMLQPLDQEYSQELVAHLLQVDDLPLKVREMILDKAEGNPFYVEEVIRSLLDTGMVVRENGHWRAVRQIERISVPDTLSAVITTRLDRLDEESRQVAQTASVIGRQFPYTVLENVHEMHDLLDRTLTDLQRRELIREKSRLPQRLYMFKHALTQETVYASLLLKRRRELHNLVAECLERNEPERVNEIAHHYLEARKPGKALPYLVEAGSRAAHAYSTQEAIGFFTQAIDLLQRVDADISLARRAFEGLGNTLEFAYDFPQAADNYRNMIAYGETHADIPMQVSGKNKLAKVVGMGMANFAEALSLLQNAEQLAIEADDLPGIAEGSMIQCAFCTAQANFDDAVVYLQKAVNIGRQLEMDETRLYGMAHIANTYTFMGLFEDAWQISQEAKALAIETGNRQHLSELLAFPIPFYHLRNGDLELARQCVQEGADIAAQIGSIPSLLTGNYMLGYLAHLKGDYDTALNHYQAGLDIARSGGVPFYEALLLCLIGTVYLDIGAAYKGEALKYHDQAVKILANPGGMMFGAAAWGELGFCEISANNLELARKYFQQGLTIPTAMMHIARPQLLVGNAYVDLLEKKVDAAFENVQEAGAFIEERQMKYHAPLVSLAYGKVFLEQGKAEAALEQFTRAGESARRLGMLPLVWQANVQAARVLQDTGRGGEAQDRYDQALSLIHEIEGLFDNPEHREVFAVNTRLALEV